MIRKSEKAVPSKPMLYLLIFSYCFLLCGCNQTNSHQSISMSEVPLSNSYDLAKSYSTISKSGDNTILIPTSPKNTIIGNRYVDIDLSNTSDGYIFVEYHGHSSKVKLQLTGPNNITYTFDITSKSCCLPLSSDTGKYSLKLFENVSGVYYATVYSGDFSATLQNPFGPYLYPNMYVNYTEDSQAVALANQLCSTSDTPLDTVSTIYHYVTETITYDYEKAANVSSGYLPIIDTILQEQKGICFDYAAVMAAMLRSQNIPTRLEIGYAGETYHAWISTYIDDIGWIDNLIQFDGQQWTLLDPTFASTGKNDSRTYSFITNKSNYSTLYMY